jgi:hypothetical protein
MPSSVFCDCGAYCFHLQCRGISLTRNQTYKHRRARITPFFSVAALRNLRLSLFFLLSLIFFFRNDSKSLPDYKESHPRKQKPCFALVLLACDIKLKFKIPLNFYIKSWHFILSFRLSVQSKKERLIQRAYMPVSGTAYDQLPAPILMSIYSSNTILETHYKM